MIKKEIDYQTAIDLIHELLKDENLSSGQKQYLVCRLSGLTAEKETAYRLSGSFAKQRDLFVLNNIKISNHGQNLQIDHLIVSRKALYIIESKSVSDRIGVNEYDEWCLYYGKKTYSINSPVEQVTLQKEKLMDFLQDNLSKFRISVLGFQAQINIYPGYTFVAISKKGKIIGKGRNKHKNTVLKHDLIPGKIKKMEQQGVFRIFNDKNFLHKNEVRALVDFLLESDMSTAPYDDIFQWALENGLVKQDDQPQQDDSLEDLNICPSCKQSSRIIRYGKYGYYFSCESCENTSSIKEKCPSCGHQAPNQQEKRLLLSCLPEM